jgi:hypothetical protein
MLAIEVSHGLEGLDDAKADWHFVLAQHPRPRFYHFFEWWHAYLSTLEPAADAMYFVRFRDQNGPLAIVPIKHSVWRLFGIPVRELSFPNHPHMPLQDALYRPGVDVQALLVQWLRRSRDEAGLSWDLMRLYGVMGESPLASGSSPGLGKRPGQACAYIDCTRPYEHILRGFSKNLQGNLRKARNKWAKEPDGRFLAVTAPAQLAARFPDFLRVESSGWKGASGSGTAIALHADLTRFYETLIDEFSSLGNVCLYCLELHGEVIAAEFCIRDHDTVYLLKIGYDEAWSQYSPGSLLLEYVLKDAAADPSMRYVNLVTDMDWQKIWRPQLYEVYNLTLFNATPVGHLCRIGMELKRRVKGTPNGKDSRRATDLPVPNGETTSLPDNG